MLFDFVHEARIWFISSLAAWLKDEEFFDNIDILVSKAMRKYLVILLLLKHDNFIFNKTLVIDDYLTLEAELI